MICTVQFSVSGDIVTRIKASKTTGGGFQSILKSVRANLVGNVLTFDARLLARVRHAANGGKGGGYQRLLQKIIDQIV